MTTLRLRSLPVHGAVELTIGLATMVAPFAFGLAFGAAGTVVAVLAGALIVGLALNASLAGIASVSMGAQRAHDVGGGVGLFGAALMLALAGDMRAGAFITAAAIAQLALTATTRYASA